MVGLLASFLLGGAFLLAGGSKIVAGDQWRSSLAGMGVPIRLVPAVALLVPPFEIVLGALVFVRFQPQVMAIVALGALVVFTVQIAVQLGRGRRPVCACFGAWSAKPLGVGHLARNAVLMALAVVVLVTA